MKMWDEDVGCFGLRQSKWWSLVLWGQSCSLHENSSAPEAQRGQGELRPSGEEHPEFNFPELKFPHHCTFPAHGSVLLLPFPRQTI